LDTHILLWSLAGHQKGKALTPRLLDEDNQVFFSVASLWEIAVKAGLGKLDADVAVVRRAA
jgi:PIN domain nuclease of toxin-antitoxin system